MGANITPERAAFLVVRAARCRRRLILTLVLLVYTAATWSYRLMPGFAYPWWYATIPTGLLLAVLVMGRLAARKMKAADLAYRAGAASLPATSRGRFVSYSDDVEYESDDPDFYDDDALPYVNDQFALPQVPATQLIPEAVLRREIQNHLKDDPELETRWSANNRKLAVK